MHARNSKNDSVLQCFNIIDQSTLEDSPYGGASNLKSTFALSKCMHAHHWDLPDATLILEQLQKHSRGAAAAANLPD